MGPIPAILNRMEMLRVTLSWTVHAGAVRILPGGSVFGVSSKSLSLPLPAIVFQHNDAYGNLKSWEPAFTKILRRCYSQALSLTQFAVFYKAPIMA